MQRPALTALRRDWRGRLPEQAAMRVNHVDQADLQGNVLCGYGNSFRHALYLFVQVIEPAEGRRWIGELAGQVTDAVPWPEGWRPDSTLNVALSHAGLETLGVPEPVLKTFPQEFQDGMGKRASLLGDLGESAPAKWETGLETEADVLVTVAAQDPDAMDERLGALLKRLAGSRDGLEVVYLQHAALLGGNGSMPAREHFGFADGFSQPAIRGNAGPTQRDGMGTPGRFGRWHNVRPGEFVLGYKGEDGVIPETPVEPLRRSGSFMVVRKLQQDVEGFQLYLEDNAAGEEEQRLLAAKLVGRWQDGRSLVVDLNPELRNGPRGADFTARINRFLYQRQDPDGHRCPLGSHVRRANPRDDLGGQFGWHGKLAKRHRIIRRGMPYDDRDWLGRKECGLMFVCYQASILRQFEVIQGKWLNDGDAFWLGGETDLLTAGRHPLSEDLEAEPAFGSGRMTIQGRPPRYLTAVLPFVTTRGGGYYFTPGLGALRALGSAYWL